MTFLDHLKSLDASATPGPWAAERRAIGSCLAVKAWHGHDGHPLYAPFLVRGRFADQMYSDDWKHCGESGTGHSGPGGDYIPTDAALIVALRNSAPAIAALVEAAEAYRNAVVDGGPYNPTPMLDALSALNKEAT